MDIYIPRPIFEYFCESSSVQYLCKNEAKEILIYKNVQYVTTGYAGSGERGNIWCLAKEVVAIEKYDGDLKPLSYDECHIEVMQGKRDRGYNGQLFTCKGRNFVTIDGESITFLPTEKGTQFELF